MDSGDVSLKDHLAQTVSRRTKRYDLHGAISDVMSDILVLQEYTFEGSGSDHLHVPQGYKVVELPLSGLNEVPPLKHLDGHLSLVVASKFPITNIKTIRMPVVQDLARSRFLDLTIDSPLGPFTLLAIHLTRELFPFSTLNQVAFLGEYIRRRTHGPLIMAGDHNLWRRAARPLLPRNLKESFKQPTWPAQNPKHQIDHIWVRGFKAAGEVMPRNGSDHLPVRATIFDV